VLRSLRSAAPARRSHYRPQYRPLPRTARPKTPTPTQDYFSIVAFFIFLRETLEASVIIAVLLQVRSLAAAAQPRTRIGGCLAQ
jgi:hypothetical protein